MHYRNGLLPCKVKLGVADLGIRIFQTFVLLSVFIIYVAPPRSYECDLDEKKT